MLFIVSSPASAAEMQLTSAEVTAAGETARICVSLLTEGREVAGTQNDLVWDGDCATLTEGSCAANPGHGKSLNTTFPAGSDFTLRAFLLSITDVRPIPDGDLYCCEFTSELDRPGSCPVRIRRARASDPQGGAIDVATTNGAITFAGAVSSGDGGGCQLTNDGRSSSPVLILALWVLAACMRLSMRNPQRSERHRLARTTFD